jgi:hypothetical protein
MDGLGPAAQFPIIYYTIARFQVYLKKIKKKRNFVHQFEKKKTAAAKTFKKSRSIHHKRRQEGRHRVRSKICYRVSQRAAEK